MAENTPAPWKASKPDMFGDINIQGPEDALAIAAVTNGEARRLAGRWEEHLANARLIESAPSLLKALRVCAHLMDAHEPSETAWDAALDQARAIMAKATGTDQ